MLVAQFRDDFNHGPIEGWFGVTGDGDAKLELVPMDGFLRMKIDATAAPEVVWYSFIKRDVTDSLDLAKLANPAYELRVEARVRTHVAPRRVNFMLNTSRTTNYHEHLREYDIGTANEWQVISFLTDSFDAKPGDQVFVQFCATDFGPDTYEVDVDYYRADVVKKASSGRDLGEPLIHHPPVLPIDAFTHHVPVTHDSVVSTSFPTVNYADWQVGLPGGERAAVLNIANDLWPVLRWDFGDLAKAKATSQGMVELTTASLASGGDYRAALGRDFGEEFGKVRLIEILRGDAAWDEAAVTYANLTGGAPYAEVFNTQMVIDLPLAAEPGGKTYFMLPRPVMQRLLDGTTKGLVLRPLGAVAAAVFASEQTDGSGPVLHFSTQE
ncbi:hypothetical protein [Actomonas aquatica]|uniref:Uncharacterized protein n=1 Tax=Actomonas aquatica TaxID=2866162 RepID=A0ABZ1C772_9BACT|nr:hypothetical protein [Opitutus sp. WL0086]WRQ87439.1 hypothetical protein K1X11_021710 [Opitutus sp. WL0086]